MRIGYGRIFHWPQPASRIIDAMLSVFCSPTRAYAQGKNQRPRWARKCWAWVCKGQPSSSPGVLPVDCSPQRGKPPPARQKSTMPCSPSVVSVLWPRSRELGPPAGNTRPRSSSEPGSAKSWTPACRSGYQHAGESRTTATSASSPSRGRGTGNVRRPVRFSFVRSADPEYIRKEAEAPGRGEATMVSVTSLCPHCRRRFTSKKTARPLPAVPAASQ